MQFNPDCTIIFHDKEKVVAMRAAATVNSHSVGAHIYMVKFQGNMCRSNIKRAALKSVSGRTT